MLIPKFKYGKEVRVIKNIRNDSNTAQQKKGEMLVRRGNTGFIRQSGVFQQDQIIYQVHFLDIDKVYGCKESELIAAETPWLANIFEYGDQANLTIALSVEGERIGNKGQLVDVLSVDRTQPSEINYRILIGEHDVMVPERALYQYK
ncbi:MAG: nitrogen fixation protein NifZ [Colwellia sp.]